jgi:DNA polymerase-1
MDDINKILAEATALLKKHNVEIVPAKKIASITAKKKPVIKAGANYHYDPKTYSKLHKRDNWHLVDTIAGVEALVEHLMKTKPEYLSVDTETKPVTEWLRATDVPPHVIRRYVKKNPNDIPFGISVSDDIDAWFITTCFGNFKDLLLCEEITKIFHNAKYDQHMLQNIGLKVAGKIYDTTILFKLFNENLLSFKLKDLAVKFIDIEANKWDIMKNNWMYEHKTNDWTVVPKELMGDYGASDAWWTIRLFKEFLPFMEQYGLATLFETEAKVLATAYDIERKGFQVNRTYLKGLEPSFKADIEAQSAEIYEMAGKVFKMGSAQQLYEFFKKLGVPESDIKYTDKGNPSFDKSQMERLSMKYDVCNKIVELKQSEKLLSTYVHNIINTLPVTDRTHCNINITEASTGRMSITDPALQTLPKKDKRIRSAFVPAPGKALFFFDLDQIEYRLFAHYSREVGLIDSIKKGWDVHRATAAIIYKKAYDDVTGSERDRGKTLNFALIYGVGLDHLADMLKVTKEDASRIKREYFMHLPNAKLFLNTVQDAIKTKGYVKNYYGRRRRLSTQEAYKAPNALIQGCAADFIKSKIPPVHELLRPTDSDLVNIVHDEVIAEISIPEIEMLVPKIKSLIDDLETFRVPITCGCEWSLKSWGHKADYDLTKSYEENCIEFNKKYMEVM